MRVHARSWLLGWMGSRRLEPSAGITAVAHSLSPDLRLVGGGGGAFGGTGGRTLDGAGRFTLYPSWDGVTLSPHA